MQENAYFRLNNKEDGVYLVTYPATVYGEKLSFAEIKRYVEDTGIEFLEPEDIDIKIHQAMEHSSDISEVKLVDYNIRPIGETVKFTISADDMSATMRVHAGFDDGTILRKEDFARRMAEVEITHCIVDGIIDEWLKDKRYCTDIQVAIGVPPEESTDAVIEYMFDKEAGYRPTIREDGSVDFHQLNLLNDVGKGDKLAVLTPAYQGENGMNVHGVVLPSRNPVRKSLKHGKNVELSEDGCVLIASSGGYVEMDREKVLIHNTYTIKGNVGAATGDVDFDGIVRISGDVLTGYSVKASIDIHIQGVVEGATLSAGRDIVIASGVHGIARAKIIAGGDITVSFIQESVVAAGGSIYAGSILYSKVTSKDSIVVDSGKGLVKGGELRAKALIAVRTVGSARAGANIQLAVGTDPDEIAAFVKLEAQLGKRQAELAELHQTIVFLNRKKEKDEPMKQKHRKLVAHMPEQLAVLNEEIEYLKERHNKMKLRLIRSEAGKIVVKGTVYEGADISISNIAYHVSEDLAQCQFAKKGKEIDITSL